MTKSPQKNVPDMGIELGAACMPSELAFVRATVPGLNLVPYDFVWEKGKTMDFSETIVVYDLRLATDDRSDKKFLLTSNIVPWGLYTPPCPGAIYMY